MVAKSINGLEFCVMMERVALRRFLERVLGQALDANCLDVLEKRGVLAAKFTVRIVRQSVNSTIVQWQMPDGSWSAAQRRFPRQHCEHIVVVGFDTDPAATSFKKIA